MSSPSTIGRVAIMCAACFGILVFAAESGPKTAPPPWPAEVKARALVSRPDLIEVSIQLPRPQAIPATAGGVSGDRIELLGATGYASDAEAELPIIRQFVAIPECDRVDLRVEVGRVETTAGVAVRPPSLTVGGSDPALPKRPGVPRSWARLVGIQRARGQALALIEIYPVRYDHGFLVDSSVFEDNESAGIRFESADGLVTQSRMEGNAGGVVCLDHSSPVIEESKIDQSTGGVTAAESSYPVVGYGSIGGSNCVTNSTGYHVSNLSAGTIYARHDYWGSICCKASKFYGNVSCDSCETSSICDGAAAPVVLSLAEPAASPTLPKALDLVSAAPNPFNPTVRIRFAVPAGGARIQLVIYNVRGQRVAVLEDGAVPPGYHERVWNGIDTRGGPVASGIYFAQMRSAGFQKAMKIVLLK